MLSRVTLFATLPRNEVEHLARILRPVECPAGTLVFHEGTYGNQYYIVLQGEVEIIKGLGTDGERLIVYDWKTGQVSENEVRQLACYAMYTSSKWEVPILSALSGPRRSEKD